MSNILRYKYLPIDESFQEPFDKKGSLSIIKDGTIKFSHPKEFNDPFDCYPEIDIQKVLSHTSKKKHLFKFIGDNLGLSPAQRIQEKPKQLKKLEKGLSDKSHANLINDQIGICCLSRNPLNLLMWAHYATKHTGFVIEFSIPTESTSFDIDTAYYLTPFPVDYSTVKPIITSGASDEFNKYFLTKGKDWEYEQEERVIDYRQSGVHPYNRTQLVKSVIVGMNMSDLDFVVLKNAIDDVNNKHGTNITIHKAEPVKGEFALFVPGRDDLNIHNIVYSRNK